MVGADAEHLSLLWLVILAIVMSAVRKNGTPMPSEYTLSNFAPSTTLDFVPANNNIDPRIGPAHGVQAAAKVTPIMTAPR